MRSMNDPVLIAKMLKRFEDLQKGIPWPTSYCNCCKERYCDKNGDVKPLNKEVEKEWQAAKSGNICPQCGYSHFSAFWLRGDGIECNLCR